MSRSEVTWKEYKEADVNTGAFKYNNKIVRVPEGAKVVKHTVMSYPVEYYEAGTPLRITWVNSMGHNNICLYPLQ